MCHTTKLTAEHLNLQFGEPGLQGGPGGPGSTGQGDASFRFQGGNAFNMFKDFFGDGDPFAGMSGGGGGQRTFQMHFSSSGGGGGGPSGASFGGFENLFGGGAGMGGGGGFPGFSSGGGGRQHGRAQQKEPGARHWGNACKHSVSCRICRGGRRASLPAQPRDPTTHFMATSRAQGSLSVTCCASP